MQHSHKSLDVGDVGERLSKSTACSARVGSGRERKEEEEEEEDSGPHALLGGKTVSLYCITKFFIIAIYQVVARSRFQQIFRQSLVK